jgi:hypothetical protein
MPWISVSLDPLLLAAHGISARRGIARVPARAKTPIAKDK